MILKAIIPPGQTEITVNGLHQWDYGQQLEIESPDLPAMVEVHFACVGMQSAEVRTCSAVSGKLTVAIPDLCLEQSAPIIAWVFAINGTEGTTVKTITLPIIPRTRPQVVVGVPRDNTDAYTQFLTEVNNAVGTLKEGNTTVTRALSAERAQSASYADAAGMAQRANTAETAESTAFATRALGATYASQFSIYGDEGSINTTITKTGLYLVVWSSTPNMTKSDFIFIDDLTAYACSGDENIYYDAVDHYLWATDSGTIHKVYHLGTYEEASSMG